MSVQCAVRPLAALPAAAGTSRSRRVGGASHVAVAAVPSSPRRPRRAASVAPVRAAESSPPAAAPAPPSSGAAAGKAVVPDEEFTLAKVSFGVIGLGVGGTLLSLFDHTGQLKTFLRKYAELKPVPCTTYADAFALREKCATPILNQVRSDVTRYRYGDEQHLDEALKRIFQYGLVTDDGKYSLVLVFEAKALEISDFEKRQAKFTSFFGPGIKAEIGKGGDDLYEVRLISETT
uniref:Uncharacterized protein n=1 Tax=Oryza rufipogon TaxID=4529 RepID=A0A0E0QHY8_ORYRU